MAVVLWATEALPIAVTGIVGVVLLVLVKAVPDVEAALFGFSQPVPYFLIGILTLGLAVQRSGLAERMAIYMIRLAGGSPRALCVQMLFSFAALTFALPSASTRGAIMVHVYEQVMSHWQVPLVVPMPKAIILAMGAPNRLGSTALVPGRITPTVAAPLIGEITDAGVSCTRWLVRVARPLSSGCVLGG